MEIKKQSEGLSKRDLYNLSRSPKMEKMSDHVGETLAVDKYLLFEDENSDGTKTEVLSITNGESFLCTNSQTAIGEFLAILDIMDGEPFSVEIISGTSKNNRTYVTLALV